MAYYLPEGYFGPVCDVITQAEDEIELIITEPPITTECIVPWACDEGYPTDLPWDPPRWECYKDETVVVDL